MVSDRSTMTALGTTGTYPRAAAHLHRASISSTTVGLPTRVVAGRVRANRVTAGPPAAGRYWATA
ncbi:MAG: hypothetical protein ACFNZX_10195 [Actinomyces sp.]